MDALDIEPSDDEGEDVPELPPLPVRRALVQKAAHRQPRIVDDGRRSFWLTAPREGFTKVGASETAKTSHTRAAASISPRLIEE